jgi:endothelin-converting enzyme
MDEARIEQLGLAPVKPQLDAIAALETHDEVAAHLAALPRLGVNTPLGGFVGADAKNSTQYIFLFWQSGLGLPDRD